MHRNTPPDEEDCQVTLNSPSNRSGLPLSAVSAHPTRAMKINIRTNDTVLTATLLGSKAARDFASLLPLTLTMADFGRVEGSVEALDRPGSTAVTFELADHSEGRR